MLNKHKSELMEIIKISDLDPHLFEGIEEEIDGYNSFVIKCEEIPARYCIHTSENDFNEFMVRSTNISPGMEFLGWYRCDLEELSEDFNIWIFRVKEYLEDLELPDVWKMLYEQKPFLSNLTLNNEDTSEYSDVEKKEIRELLNKLLERYKTELEPDENQLEFLENRFAYISEALDRLNRFDWKHLVIGTLISISVNFCSDAEKRNRVFEIFQEVFSTVIYLLS